MHPKSILKWPFSTYFATKMHFLSNPTARFWQTIAFFQPQIMSFSSNIFIFICAIGPTEQWPSFYQSLSGGSLRHGIMQPKISYATQGRLDPPDSDHHCTSHCPVGPFAMGLYSQKSVVQRKGDWTHQTVTVFIPVTVRWVPLPWDMQPKISYATQGRLDPPYIDHHCTSHCPVGPFAMGLNSKNIKYATQ